MSMFKKNLRKSIITRRNLLKSSEIFGKGNQIKARLMALELFKQAQVIMLYMDYKNEVPTREIIKTCLALGKRVILPVVVAGKEQLSLVEIKGFDDMVASKHGILEPPINALNKRRFEDIDLILAPGVAFDLNGYRLGYGGGYYDRLLASNAIHRQRINVIALAFALQIVEYVPHEGYDQPIDGLITEDNVYIFKEKIWKF